MALFAVTASGCGRSIFGELTPSEFEGGVAGDGSLTDGHRPGNDGGIFPFDGSLHDGGRRPFDTGIEDATPPPPFDSGTILCMTPGDCDARFGPPNCPGGGPGKWDCVNNQCVATCQQMTCSNDCDCPSSELCIGTSCQIGNRNNLCCTNPFCPSGAFCIQPGGMGSTCPGVPDSGIPDAPAGCFNDCDCPQFAGCFNGQCQANMRPRPNLCCFDQPCPLGEFCELPGGSTSFCMGGSDGGLPGDARPICINDCDCPPQEGCGSNGQCAPNGTARPNLCCFDSPCPPGAFCEIPGGGGGFCPGNGDGGVFDSGPSCFNDCDCPPFAECLGGQCVSNPSPRPNLCCFDQPCPPGAFCELPGGQSGVCQGGFDGGALPDATSFCNTDCDCPFNGSACLNGQCLPNVRPNECCFNPMCPPGQLCVFPGGGLSTCGGIDGGVNQDAGDAGPPDSGFVPIGAPCSQGANNCTFAGFCIDQSQGFPGGYCSESCNGMMCPPNASCFDVGMMNSICLEDCMNTNDCRMGYECDLLGINPQRVCWPIPPASTNPMGAPVGSACMMDSDCVSGLQCLQVPGGGFPGGYCTKEYCDPNTNPCPGGSSCYAFPGLFSLCLADCPSGGSQSTCRTGYYCLGATGQPGVCINN
jgi:hypothetical protein